MCLRGAAPAPPVATGDAAMPEAPARLLVRAGGGVDASESDSVESDDDPLDGEVDELALELLDELALEEESDDDDEASESARLRFAATAAAGLIAGAAAFPTAALLLSPASSAL